MAQSVKTLSVYLNLNSKAFTTGLRKMQRRLKRFGSTMSNIGSQMTNNITIPMALAGSGAIKLASDFNASMTKIETLVGTSAKEVEGLKDKILDLAGETAQAPKDLADGLFFIQSAGFKGKEGLEALEVSAKGAAMGMGEMTDIANAVTSLMTAYAKENMSAAQAGDLLHETLKQGKFEASEFMDKIGQVLPTAAAFGISFEQLGASIATMSKLSGDAAGTLTAVNALMMKLNAPSEQQLKILNDLFGSYENLSASLKTDFMSTLEKIFTGLEGNDLALTKVFGSSKAVKAAFATLGLQSETYTEVLDGMNKSLGNVDKGFKRVSEESSFKFNKALSDLKIVGIELGSLILPLATKMAQKLTDIANAFSGLSTSAQKNMIKTAAAIGLLAPALSIVGKLSLLMSTLIKHIIRLGVVSKATSLIMMLFNPLTYVFAGISLIIVGMIKHFDNLKKPIVETFNAFAKLNNEIGIIGVGVQVVAGAFNLFTTAAKKMRERVKFYIKSVINLVESLGDVLLNLFDKQERKRAVDEFFNKLESDALDYAAALKQLQTDLENDLKNNTEPIEYITIADIEDGIKKGKLFGEALVNSVKVTVEKMSSQLGDVMFKNTSPFISGNTDLSNTLVRAPQAPSFNLSLPPEQIQKATQSLQVFSDTFLSNFNNTYQQAASTVSNFGVTFADSFADMVSTTITSGGNMAEAFGGFMRKIIADLTAAIIKMTVLKGIMSALGVASGGGVGSVIGSIFGFSQGGLVTGATVGIVGEGRSVSMSNPEVIAPLDKLKNYIGGGSSRLHGEISGSNILLSNSRSSITQDRVSGSVTDF